MSKVSRWERIPGQGYFLLLVLPVDIDDLFLFCLMFLLSMSVVYCNTCFISAPDTDITISIIEFPVDKHSVTYIWKCISGLKWRMLDPLSHVDITISTCHTAQSSIANVNAIHVKITTERKHMLKEEQKIKRYLQHSKLIPSNYCFSENCILMWWKYYEYGPSLYVKYSPY